MNNTPQLIVRYTSTMKPRITTFLAMGFLIFMFTLSQSPYPALYGFTWMPALIKPMLYIGTGLLLLFAFFSHVFTYEGPAVVLDQHGIWIRHFNFIPWENVEKMNPYVIWGTPVEAIGIKVKDIATVYRDSERIGKMGLMWTRHFGPYHITLTKLDIDNAELMKFFQQHVSTDHPHIAYALTQNKENTQP